MKLNKFVPLEKMEEQSDGTLHVFGIVTAEQPDLEKEVCDYATTKELYEKRAAENLKKTSIPGMTPSMMPFREMHQAVTQGAGRSMVCDDASKTIRMGFHVVDGEAVKKWKAGCFVGFSQGGAYVKRWPDPDFPECTRYTADPIEVSAVDSPCLPIALVESMKGRSVTLAKANGVTETVPLQLEADRVAKLEREIAAMRELLKEKKTKRVDGVDLTASCFAHVGDPEDPETWKLPINFPGDEEKTKSHIRNALARFEQTEGMSDEEKKAARKKIVAAAKEHGIEVGEADKAAVARTIAKLGVAKGLYEVGWLGDLLESLHWLCLQTEFERDMEDDGSKVPDGLREAWIALLAEFKAMAVEEADELAAAGGKGEKAVKITDQAGLTKAAKTIHDHLEQLHEAHKAQGEHMKKAHEAIEEKHAKVGERIEKCMKAAKDAAEGEEPEEAVKAAAETELQKELTALKAEFAELTKKLANTPASGGAHSGVVESEIAKGVTAPAGVPPELAGIVNTPPAQ